jgi:hypothetical protein
MFLKHAMSGFLIVGTQRVKPLQLPRRTFSATSFLTRSLRVAKVSSLYNHSCLFLTTEATRYPTESIVIRT